MVLIVHDLLLLFKTPLGLTIIKNSSHTSVHVSSSLRSEDGGITLVNGLARSARGEISDMNRKQVRERKLCIVCSRPSE